MKYLNSTLTNSVPTLRLKELPTDEQSREKLQRFGPEALTDAELLAIILRTGTKKLNVLDLSKKLLADSLGLPLLFRKKWRELANYPGIGPVKAITLEAVFELSRRSHTMSINNRMQFSESKSVADYFRPLLRDEDHENFYVVGCDNQLKMLFHKKLAKGQKNSVSVDLTTLVKELILGNASNAFILHNHPSGASTASEPDKVLTRRVRQACDLVGIKLLDHIIIFGNDYRSMADNGEL